MSRKKHGVALPIVKKGFESGGEIVRKHLGLDPVYFSTDSRFDKDKLSQIDIVLFYNSTEDVYFLAELISFVTFGLNTGIPKDSAAFSPPDYKDEPKKLWLKLKNLREIKLDDLCNYYFKGIAVNEKIINSKRDTQFYFDITY